MTLGMFGRKDCRLIFVKLVGEGVVRTVRLAETETSTLKNSFRIAHIKGPEAVVAPSLD
jgi:hypothetical protein